MCCSTMCLCCSTCARVEMKVKRLLVTIASRALLWKQTLLLKGSRKQSYTIVCIIHIFIGDGDSPVFQGRIFEIWGGGGGAEEGRRFTVGLVSKDVIFPQIIMTGIERGGSSLWVASPSPPPPGCTTV